MGKVGRPRGPSSRVLGASVPEPDADRFDELCESLGRNKSPIIRDLIYAFMADHGVQPHEAQEQEQTLPLTG